MKPVDGDIRKAFFVAVSMAPREALDRAVVGAVVAVYWAVSGAVGRDVCVAVDRAVRIEFERAKRA